MNGSFQSILIFLSLIQWTSNSSVKKFNFTLQLSPVLEGNLINDSVEHPLGLDVLWNEFSRIEQELKRLRQDNEHLARKVRYLEEEQLYRFFPIKENSSEESNNSDSDLNSQSTIKEILMKLFENNFEFNKTLMGFKRDLDFIKRTQNYNPSNISHLTSIPEELKREKLQDVEIIENFSSKNENFDMIWGRLKNYSKFSRSTDDYGLVTTTANGKNCICRSISPENYQNIKINNYSLSLELILYENMTCGNAFINLHGCLPGNEPDFENFRITFGPEVCLQSSKIYLRLSSNDLKASKIHQFRIGRGNLTDSMIHEYSLVKIGDTYKVMVDREEIWTNTESTDWSNLNRNSFYCGLSICSNNYEPFKFKIRSLVYHSNSKLGT